MFNGGLGKKLDSIREEIAALKHERKALEGENARRERINQLESEIVTLGIEKSKRTEEHEREKRETLHMVGLEKKRQEFEIDSAKRDAKLTVREENLAADRERFEEQMKFHDTRFEEEVGYLKGLMAQVLERLPTVNVEKTVKG